MASRGQLLDGRIFYLPLFRLLHHHLLLPFQNGKTLGRGQGGGGGRARRRKHLSLGEKRPSTTADLLTHSLVHALDLQHKLTLAFSLSLRIRTTAITSPPPPSTRPLRFPSLLRSFLLHINGTATSSITVCMGFHTQSHFALFLFLFPLLWDNLITRLLTIATATHTQVSRGSDTRTHRNNTEKNSTSSDVPPQGTIPSLPYYCPRCTAHTLSLSLSLCIIEIHFHVFGEEKT